MLNSGEDEPDIPNISEPGHSISYKTACTPSEESGQPVYPLV